MIHIDGSHGEGGGQVLRSSLTLSVLTGQPLRIDNIRARRSKPGLRAQHLASVQAAAAISQAEVTGATLGSATLLFRPGRVQPGPYRFDIGTAGSTSLVLQTIFLPLALADAPASPVPTTITECLRLFDGLTSLTLNLWFVHFSAIGPAGILESSFMEGSSSRKDRRGLE